MGSELKPWRKCPFGIGKKYRVKKSFKAPRDEFRAGEVLTFKSDAWSRYDGMTGYFFSQPGSSMLRTWDIDDDGDLKIWKELFEAVTEIFIPAAPTYVSAADSGKVVVKSFDDRTGNLLISWGFAPAQDEKNTVSLDVADDNAKAELFSRLRDAEICFSFGRERSPSEVFEHLRDQGLLKGTFKEIAWTEPSKWIVRPK